MSRQRLLIWILAALAVFGLPIHFLDAAAARQRDVLQAEQARLEPLRQQVAAIREQESQLAGRAARLDAISSRLIAAQPFATIQGELMAMAARSGVTLGALTLEGPAAVSEWPGVVRYQAMVQVAGDWNQFLAFLRQLEESSLLIEVPEVSLHMQTARVDHALVLGFYGKR